jgi:hypothetical protein
MYFLAPSSFLPLPLSLLGWYFTHDSPDHYRPTAIGGSAEEGMNGHGTSSFPASTTSSGGLVKIVHSSTSPAAATPTVAKRSNGSLERVVARAFGQAADIGVETRDTLPVVIKKVRNHQQVKRRAWQQVI